MTEGKKVSAKSGKSSRTTGAKVGAGKTAATHPTGRTAKKTAAPAAAPVVALKAPAKAAAKATTASAPATRAAATATRATLKTATHKAATHKAATHKAATQAWGDRIPGRQSQRELKEEVLYETAGRWFNRHGYHGTSLNDLAKELGITKAALYNYVKDKRELLYNIHQRSLRVARAARDAALREKTGIDRVRKLIYTYVVDIIASPAETLILLEDGALAPDQAEEVLNVRRELDLELRGWIAQGIKDKTIAACDPKLVAFMITGSLAWVNKWYDPQGAWTGEQVAEAMSALYARMLSAGHVAHLHADVGQIVPCGGLWPLPTK